MRFLVLVLAQGAATADLLLQFGTTHLSFIKRSPQIPVKLSLYLAINLVDALALQRAFMLLGHLQWVPLQHRLELLNAIQDLLLCVTLVVGDVDWGVALVAQRDGLCAFLASWLGDEA